MSRNDRAVGVAAVVAVGIATLGVPLFDVWDDIARGQSLFSSAIKNSVTLGLAVGIVAAGVWLWRVDWGDRTSGRSERGRSA